MAKPRFWGRCQHCAEDGEPTMHTWSTFRDRKKWWLWHTDRTDHTWPWRPAQEDFKFGTPHMSEVEAQALADAELVSADAYKPPRRGDTPPASTDGEQ